MFKIKKRWQNFLKKLARASHEQYGDKAPSCCDTDAKNKTQAQKPPSRAKK